CTLYPSAKSLASCASLSARLAVKSKLAPSAASCSASAHPMPELAPVTNAHLPLHFFIEPPANEHISGFLKRIGDLQALECQEGITLCRSRSPCDFRRSRRRRAHTNSAASMANPPIITNHPGPGVTSMTMPTTNKVKPPR